MMWHKIFGYCRMLCRRKAHHGRGLCFRPRRPGPNQVRGVAVVGDELGAAGAARAVAAPVPPAWLDSVRPDLGKLDLRALLALSPRSGWAPDFLNPVPAGPGTTIADQLAQVRATPPEQVAAEVERSLTERDVPAPDAAWRLLDDPAATRAMLADLLEHCWQLLMAPHWPRLRDLLDADLAFRTQTLADYGLQRVLGDLHPKARWTGRAIVIDHTPAARRHLRGSGLLLIPSVFAWPDVCAVTDPPARPTLVYPARGIAELWQPARTPHSDALARLLGPGPGQAAGVTRRTGIHSHPRPTAR